MNGRGWSLWTLFVVVVPQLVCAVVAHADPPPAGSPAIPGTFKPSWNLDGVYITLGPAVSAVHLDAGWFSAAGGELSVVRVTEQKFPAQIGLAAGGVSYSGRPGGELWLEAEAAIEHPLPFALGFGVGAAAEVDAVRPPRLGVEGTIWAFAGVVPYVRLGVLQETGTFFVVGLMIKIPAFHF